MAASYPSLFGARQKSRGSVVRPTQSPVRSPFNRAYREGPQRVTQPKRVAPTVPTFRKPILMPEDGGGMDYTPSYTPGTETPQAPSFQDPGNAMAMALSARTRGEAQSKADAKKKQAAIEYGDGPEGTANPFSVVNVRARNYKSGVADLEEGLNAANLFYSGYRGKQLGDAATSYQQQQYEDATRYRATLADIEDARAAALLNADMMEMQAGGGGGGSWGDAPLEGRPGEWADLPVKKGWEPWKNSDAEYDMSGATWTGSFFIGPQGQRYDEKGRVI